MRIWFLIVFPLLIECTMGNNKSWWYTDVTDKGAFGDLLTIVVVCSQEQNTWLPRWLRFLIVDRGEPLSGTVAGRTQ